MHNDTTLLTQVLREGRAKKGLTQKALALKTQTALRTIKAIENGERFPTYEVLYRIIRELDISADQIFWPERITYTPEQKQVIREFLECSKWEQDIIVKTMRSLIRAIRDADE